MIYGYIYRITNLVNGKNYIGQSVNPFTRIKEHARCGKPYGTSVRPLYVAMREYGLDAFIFDIIAAIESTNDNVLDQLTLDNKEIFYGKLHSALVDEGGYCEKLGKGRGYTSEIVKARISNGKRGYRHTEEAKRNISIGQKRIITPERLKLLASFKIGTKHSDETKKKMSESHKGKIFTEEHRKNLTLAQLKRPSPSEETRQKQEHRQNISKATLGKVHKCSICGKEGTTKRSHAKHSKSSIINED